MSGGSADQLLTSASSTERSTANAKVCFPSVDAPFQARENVGVVVARGRMLSSVRPSSGRKTAAGLYGSSRTGSITRSVLEAQWKTLVVPARLADCSAILSFRSPLRLRAPCQHAAAAGVL